MKRCPKCNRTYPTNTQRFCTNDGGLLVAVDAPPAQAVPEGFADPDAPTKMISQDLVPQVADRFDPLKTTIGGPPERDQTSEMVPSRATASLPAPPAPRPSEPSTRPPTSAPLPPPVSQQLDEATVASIRPAPPPPPVPTSAPLPPPGQRLGEATLPSMQPAPPRPTSAPLPPPGQQLGEVTSPSMQAAPSPPAQEVSGSLPPPGPDPTAPLPASTSAPLPAPQFTGAAQAQQVQRLTAPAKKSKLPLILGILAVLVVVGIAGLSVVYVFVAKPMLEARGIIATPSESPQQIPIETPTSNVDPTPVQEAAPSPTENVLPTYTPPANAVQFVNASDRLDGKLAEHYVDFSFYYPDEWEKDPKTGVAGASNFVEVHRSLPPNFTQESVAVSWYDSAGSFSDDQDLFHTYVETKSSQFAQNIGEYRKVSEGPTKVGVYDGYEFRFEGISQKTEKGQFKIWGRVVWLPPQQSGKSGITLLMLATSLAPELSSITDVGEKGELPMILESLRFGRPVSP